MSAHKPFVITIVGAESSGKTTLAMRLAEVLECEWVPEYAREYLEKLGRDYDEKDLVKIAEHQLERIITIVSRQTSVVSKSRVLRPASTQPRATAQQPASALFAPYPLILRPADTQPRATAQQPGELKDRQASGVNRESVDSKFDLLGLVKSKIQNPNSKIIIVDGGMMNLRMWAWIKYKETIPIVEEALKNDVTDLYLLCRTKKEWTPDPLREAPRILERAWIYNQYLEVLSRGEIPMEITIPNY